MRNSPKNKNRPPQGAIKVITYTHDNNKNLVKMEAIISGRTAWALQLLYAYKHLGLTRLEAAKKYGSICLTQYVSRLRHIYGINIMTEHVFTNDTWFGRYHLLSDISISSLNGGAS